MSDSSDPIRNSKNFKLKHSWFPWKFCLNDRYGISNKKCSSMREVCEDEKWNIYNEPVRASVLGDRLDRNLKLCCFHFPPNIDYDWTQKTILDEKSRFSAIFWRFFLMIFTINLISKHIFMIRWLFRRFQTESPTVYDRFRIQYWLKPVFVPLFPQPFRFWTSLIEGWPLAGRAAIYFSALSDVHRNTLADGSLICGE